MPDAAFDLWPEIEVRTVPPLAVLRMQADGLAARTGGLLEAEVTTVTGAGDFVAHRLDVIGPRPDRERHRVVTLVHRRAYYPVTVEADVFHVASLPVPAENAGVWPPLGDWRPVANSLDELAARLRDVLASPPVRAAVASLLAAANETSPVAAP